MGDGRREANRMEKSYLNRTGQDSELPEEERSRNRFDASGRFEREYQIIRELGSGGEGRVYLVLHLATEQLRAAKYLAVSGSSDRLHELTMMKRLHHPSLPEVIDVLREEQSVWLILSYVRGKPLNQIAGTQVHAELFFSIARQLSEVLCYLHERDAPILHLDIKPSNLLLQQNGRLVLIDFGAALRGHPGIAPERCCGTPGFAAPEQYLKGHYLDVRTDLYGAGAVLYFLLYGRIYQKAETEGKKKRRGKWWVKRAIRTSLGKKRQSGKDQEDSTRRRWEKDAEHVLQKCLREKMEERYLDSRMFYTAVVRARRRWRRRRQYAGVGISAGLLLLLLIFCMKAIPAELVDQIALKTVRYEQLLTEAEGAGFERAGQCYREAAALCPQEESLYLHLLTRILRDRKFDREEETLLLELLYRVPAGEQKTVQEQLRERGMEYGRLAYELAVAYWYFYPDTGGRTAAVKWFDEAVNMASMPEGETEGWTESAKIHKKIAGYYEQIGKKDSTGRVEADCVQLWEDLCTLWESDSFQREESWIRAQAAKELLACMIMDVPELKKQGVSQTQIRCTLSDLRSFLTEIKTVEEKKPEQLQEPELLEGLLRQCDAAETSFQRAYRAEGERKGRFFEKRE